MRISVKVKKFLKFMFIVLMLSFSQGMEQNASHWTEYVFSFVLFIFGAIPLLNAIEDAYKFQAVREKFRQTMAQRGEKP